MGLGLLIKPAWAYSGIKISPLPIITETGNGLLVTHALERPIFKAF